MSDGQTKTDGSGAGLSTSPSKDLLECLACGRRSEFVNEKREMGLCEKHFTLWYTQGVIDWREPWYKLDHSNKVLTNNEPNAELSGEPKGPEE